MGIFCKTVVPQLAMKLKYLFKTEQMLICILDIIIHLCVPRQILSFIVGTFTTTLSVFLLQTALANESKS